MVMVGLVRVNGLVRVVRLFGVVGDGGGGGVVDGQGIQVVWVDGTPDGWGAQVDRGCQYLKAPRAVKNCPLKVGGTPCTAFCFKALTVVSIQKNFKYKNIMPKTPVRLNPSKIFETSASSGDGKCFLSVSKVFNLPSLVEGQNRFSLVGFDGRAI